MPKIAQRVAAVAAAAFLAACGGSPREPGPVSPAAGPGESARQPVEAARSNPADVRFMSDMIGHHAQAILIAGWAPTHGAGPAIQRLAARIINSQQDEIATMQRWLHDRGQPVPEAVPANPKMQMNGAEHEMLMPGMLTREQLRQLDGSTGQDFDQMFLIFMIQHHRGALTMVKSLLDSYGAAQDQTVFKMANDISADQTAEIARMQAMLVTPNSETTTP